MSDKKTQTRARILGAATQALLERGAVEPSVGEVMGAAGLTVGGFYAHFQSKDALMLEAFEQLLGKRRELLGELDPGLSGKGVVPWRPPSTCRASIGTHRSTPVVRCRRP